MENRQLPQNILFTLVITAVGVLASAFDSIADHMAFAFGQTATMAGVYLSVFAVGCCLSAYFGGPLADRLGKRRVIVASMFALVVGLLIVSLSRVFALTALGLIVMGIGFGPTESMSSALVTDENPHNPTRWMNITQIGFGIGAIVAPVAAVWYCTKGGGSYHGVFALCALLFLVLVIVIMLTGRSRPVRVNKESGSNSFSLLKNRQFLIYALMVFLYLGYEVVAPIYFKQLFLMTGSTEDIAALSMSLFWASMLVCRFIGVFLNGKELISIKIFTLFVLAGILVLLLAQNNAIRFVGVLLYGFGCGPVWPMLFVLASRVFPERSGAVYGVMMLFSTLGSSLFPTLIGTAVGNPRMTFVIAAGIALLLLVCAIWSTQQKPSAQSAQ